MKKIMIYIFMILAICGGVFAISTSNLGNINAAGNLTVDGYAVFNDGAKYAGGGQGSFSGLGAMVEFNQTSGNWLQVFYDESNSSAWSANYISSAGDFTWHSFSDFTALLLLGEGDTGIMLRPNAGGITRIGDAGTEATTHGLVNNDDLLVTGKLEVDGFSYFDNNIFVHSNTTNTDEWGSFHQNETDFIIDVGVGDIDFSDNNITGVGLAWDSLHSYPSACPAGTYLTQLDDSVTCTALTNATGDFNVVGNLTVEGNAGFGEDDPDSVVTINDNLVLSNGVSQDAIDSAHFANSRTETVGGDIMASVQQLIVNLSAPKGTWAYTDQVFAETLPTNSQNIMKLIPTASYVFHYGAGTLSYASGTQVGIYADGQGTTEHAWGVEVAVLASDNATIEDAKVVKATLMTYTNTPTINTGHLFYGDSVNYAGEMGSVSGLTLNELAEATNNTYILLGTETIPEGNYSIYSDTTSSSYFGGNILLDNDANVTWKNGASISVNSTCIILSSPAGTGTHAVCD